jgi:TPP-dependent pyruvate/acetoin dehydrogenase alpha subunit
VLRLQRRAVEEGWFDEEEAAKIEVGAAAAVEAAVEFGRASPFPPLELTAELTYAPVESA